ncbi:MULTISPECIES: hypothetical protein [Paenibacillus]|uniref:Uncharacterized protein n=1 Tax=Paenibacillus anseongense TaxID=2682845 RepID=A0ABW9UEW7_9BACL|nr:MULTISPECIES: hypothetical protein [Paenibacillus]MBA2940240.1 hypothetical protein [Paenibacillus sp. CGMCC 1.16610]MVQ38694.1 hypothetical protein [Paenibacillus anseongense]
MVPECKITRIECYRFDDELSDKLLPGHGRDCHCGMLSISTSLGTSGLGDYEIPCGNLKGDFVQWAVVFQKLKGLSLEDGLHYVRQKKEAWGEVRTHVIESALTDLSEKLQHKSIGNKELDVLSNRSYIFDHSEAYVSF